MSTAPRAYRLGNILVRRHHLAPHQLSVALDVQHRTGLPLGQILAGAGVVSPRRIKLALAEQKIRRLLSTQRAA